MATILTSFTKHADPLFADQAATIVKQMTGNPKFPNPVPNMADVQEAYTDFQHDLVLSMGGTTSQRAIKRDQRTHLAALIKQLGRYVICVANEDEAILVSSGFPLARPKHRIGALPKPSNFVVTPGRECVRLKIKSIQGAHTYIFEYTTAPLTDKSEWTVLPTSRSKILITNLTSGTEYVFRVVAIGAHPNRTYSDCISSYVL